MNILPTVKLENMSYFEVTVPTTNGYIFTNARSNDVVIHTQNSNQRYLMGTTSNGVAEFQIDKGLITLNGNISCSNLLTASNINFTGQLQQNGVAYVGSQWTGTVGGPLYYGGTVNASNLTTPNVLLANGGIQIAGFSFVDTNRAISCGNINTNLGTLTCSTITTNNYNVNAGTGAVTCGTIIHSTYYECWVKIMQTSSTNGQVNFELTPSLVYVPLSTYITKKYAWTNSSYGDSWIPPVAGIWSISVTLNVQGTYAIMGIIKNPAFANSTDYTGASVNNVLSLTDMTTGEVMSNSVTTYLSTSDYIGIGIYGCTTFTAASWRCISTLHATLIQRTS